MLVKFVMITDGTDYIIHGSQKQSSAEMFKSLAPLWDFDPITDKALFFEQQLDMANPVNAVPE